MRAVMNYGYERSGLRTISGHMETGDVGEDRLFSASFFQEKSAPYEVAVIESGPGLHLMMAPQEDRFGPAQCRANVCLSVDELGRATPCGRSPHAKLPENSSTPVA